MSDYRKYARLVVGLVVLGVVVMAFSNPLGGLLALGKIVELLIIYAIADVICRIGFKSSIVDLIFGDKDNN
mgnify:CR=1 FL=1